MRAGDSSCPTCASTRSCGRTTTRASRSRSAPRDGTGGAGAATEHAPSGSALLLPDPARDQEHAPRVVAAHAAPGGGDEEIVRAVAVDVAERHAVEGEGVARRAAGEIGRAHV